MLMPIYSRDITGRAARRRAGYTIIELMTVILILAILVALAVPVFLDTRALAERNTCRYNQRAVESALVMWKTEHPDEEFITENCLPGDGEAFIDIDGNVPGEPQRSLSSYMKTGFDCPSNGRGVGQTGGCDFITDGISVTCLTDSQIGLRSDGEAFRHDAPREVAWDHSRGAADVTGDDGEEPTGSPLGDTFKEITGGMIALIQEFYDRNGTYPRSWGDYAFTDIGLDPADWKAAYDNIYYKPVGNRIAVQPEEGYSMVVLNAKGKELKLTPDSKWSLVYDMKTAKWYYKNVAPGQEVDISTMKVVKM